MVELVLRLAAACSILAVGVLWGVPPPALGMRVAVLLVAYSVLLNRLEARGMRNSGVAGLAAVLDCAVIAVLVASARSLDILGFLVLGPPLYAFLRYRSNPAAMAPLAAALVLAASNLASGASPSVPLLVQALGILTLGLMPGLVEMPGALQPEQATPTPEPDAELQENLRRLRQHCADLERRTSVDHIAVQIYEVAHAKQARTLPGIARRIKELVGATGITIHLVSQQDSQMVVRAADGEVPDELATGRFPLSGRGEVLARVGFDDLVNAIRSDAERAKCGSVPLKHDGKLIGMLGLVCSDSTTLEKATGLAQQASSAIAGVIAEADASADLERRHKEAETLYYAAAVTAGADTKTSVASRLVRELFDALELDHLAIYFIEGDEHVRAASAGAPVRLLDAIEWPAGHGVEGWLASGAPELAVMDALSDPRVDRSEARKRRVGSFFAAPLQYAEHPVGYVTAAVRASGGLDRQRLDTLRLIVAEASQALARLETQPASEGLATPLEFQAAIQRAERGVLIYLEPLAKESEEAGPPDAAYEQALRRLAMRLRARLPKGGLLCRRAEGDFVVLLRGGDEQAAESWANHATAIASMIAPVTGQGNRISPLGFKSRIARLGERETRAERALSA